MNAFIRHDDLESIPPPPRNARRTVQLGRQIFVARFISLLIFGVFLAVFIRLMAILLAPMIGSPSNAQIDRVEDSLRRNGKHNYTVYYHFQFKGRTFDTWKYANSHDYSYLRAGDQFPGRALMLAGYCAFTGPPWATNPSALQIIVCLAVLDLSALAFYMLYYVPYRNLWLIRNGDVTLATITTRRTGRKHRPGPYNPDHLLGYRFTTPTGSLINQEASVSNDLYNQVIEGERICVFYNPDQLAENFPYDPEYILLEPNALAALDSKVRRPA